MKNLEKLEKEFNDLLDSLTDADWKRWESNYSRSKLIRRERMREAGRVQADKINKKLI